ncbi:endonuclease/exonuclease/phosphatase family protein [Breznakiella homolactica]|uniref:Endonuclease/exonuclease/phosphatase family protein n=1 Tax=Breznakiella homolactica TaxID=2798577 RepID=A0A7T8BAJ1_9SPIR|nr:endonuclease/exonuclease/phosphatase family protein [Breznakiella homolactica]QQO09065.1 endonuclease/exonuclease/phosphatase family protein [Breznakiella homolactica]
MNSPRFSLLSLNLWKTERWADREKTVVSFLKIYEPDICCFQELQPATVPVLDNALPGYSRVEDSFRGWKTEGNIYFKNRFFREIEHGAVPLDMPEKDRRLFWVRLETIGGHRPLFVSTVHFTHQENADEMATGVSYRHNEAVLAARALADIVPKDEAAFVAGDFNDPIHPARILSSAGFSEVFNSLGLLPPVTFPSQPITDEIFMNEAIDKIMVKGPVKPLLAAVPRYYAHGFPLSDHWPVMAFFELSAF